VSKILLVPKVSDPGELRTYRPISVFTALSKALEVVMRDEMIRFIYGNRLLSPYQSGFCSGHSTATVLLKITNDIQCDCDRRLVALLLQGIRQCSAFSAAEETFTCVQGTGMSLVGSYLSDRYQCVSVGEVLLELIAGHCARFCARTFALLDIYQQYCCPDQLLSISYVRRQCTALSE
jgi:hypothetical protein